MKQVMKSSPSMTFTTFRAVLLLEILVFLIAATFHTGALGVPPIDDAALVESLCAVACMISAYAVFTRRRWALKAAIIAQVFILAGVLLGVAALLHFSYLLTPLNISFHATMLTLIIAAFVLLSMPATRAAFRENI